MLDRKSTRILRFSSESGRKTMVKLLGDMGGVSDIHVIRNNTLSFKASGKTYDAILSHVSGRIFRGLVTVEEVHLGRKSWAVDGTGNLIERSQS